MRAAGHRVPSRIALELAHPGDGRRFAECATTRLSIGGRALLLTVARDVTQAEHDKRRLADDHAFLDAVLAHAAGPIVVLAPDGRLLRVNAATARLAGSTPEAMAGRTPWELGLMTPAQGAEVAAALRDGRDPFRHQMTWRGPGGRERVVAWCATAVRDAAGGVRCAVSVGHRPQRPARRRGARPPRPRGARRALARAGAVEPRPRPVRRAGRERPARLGRGRSRATPT